jgi:CobQ-like glutamine amidotransferase family enzyme
MGGAQDRQQKLAADDFLKQKGPVVRRMVEDGIPALFVCAAYQQVGHYYKPYKGESIPGAGIIDLSTEHPGDQAKRLIGNVVAELIHPSELSGKTIVGFENHGGRTRLGPKVKPLARIRRGFGNNGEDGYEGAFYKNAIGSYFHGPLLTKNPELADWLIRKALEVKYKDKVTLKPLDDRLEHLANQGVAKSLGV